MTAPRSLNLPSNYGVHAHASSTQFSSKPHIHKFEKQSTQCTLWLANFLAICDAQLPHMQMICFDHAGQASISVLISSVDIPIDPAVKRTPALAVIRGIAKNWSRTETTSARAASTYFDASVECSQIAVEAMDRNTAQNQSPFSISMTSFSALRWSLEADFVCGNGSGEHGAYFGRVERGRAIHPDTSVLKCKTFPRRTLTCEPWNSSYSIALPFFLYGTYRCRLLSRAVLRTGKGVDCRDIVSW